MMRVALVHDWLTGMRGGEKCLEVFCELFPDADLYTLLHVQGSVSGTIEKHPIKTSFIQNLPFSKSHYRYYLPLFPKAIETFDLRGYELVLSSSHCVAKGVRTSPQTLHISYIHTPMRYIWDQFGVYFENGRSAWMVQKGMQLLRPWLQNWDITSSRNIYALIAASHHVAERIRRYYGRQSEVIHPPVDFHAFSISKEDAGFYLMVTALAPYKRVDLAIEAFNRLKQPLKIIGSGPEERHLKRMAGATVEFLGWESGSEVREAYAACRAVIFPGEEDFGIVPLEAMACGKPVIAYGKGGVLETVVPLEESSQQSPTGVFFHEQSADSLIEAVRSFDDQRGLFDPSCIREHVRPFDRQRFKERIFQHIQLKLQEFKERHHAQKTC
jgi:glycosyltransferase involved in cell wall biosynthesis